MEKAWRVSISNYALGCYICGYANMKYKEFQTTGDYCGSCQHVTVDYVDQRGDYADETIGYYDTEEEARNIANTLVPFAD